MNLPGWKPICILLTLSCFFDKRVQRTRDERTRGAFSCVCSAAERALRCIFFHLYKGSNPLWVPLSFRHWLADYDNAAASCIPFEHAWCSRRQSNYAARELYVILNKKRVTAQSPLKNLPLCSLFLLCETDLNADARELFLFNLYDVIFIL